MLTRSVIMIIVVVTMMITMIMMIMMIMMKIDWLLAVYIYGHIRTGVNL